LASDSPAGAAAPWDKVLGEFLDAAKAALGDHLLSAVLFGSAAEGNLRATSDVNLILVLSASDPDRMEALRPAARLAQAAIRLSPMFLLESELGLAAETFGLKFDDIRRRHRVLFGDDPFAKVSVPRAALLIQLRQLLLNLVLRNRAAYVMRGLRQEQLALAVADSAGPLRAAAATMRELESKPAVPPKQALAEYAASLPGEWAEVLAHISEAREKILLAPGIAAEALLKVTDLARSLLERAERMK
jgi:predicted nucleotidyltransferase